MRQQILVVDAHSQDGTSAIVENLGIRCVSYMPNLAAQRNYGAHLTTQPILLFLDADMEVQPGLLQEIVDLFNTGAAAIIIPEISIPKDWLGAGRAFERSLFEGDTSIEAARVFSRALFERLGGYDEALSGCEDWEFSRRAATVTRLNRTVTAVLHHEGNLSVTRVVRKYVAYGRGYYKLWRTNHTWFFEHANPLRPSIIRAFKSHRTATLTELAAIAVFKMITYVAGAIGFALGACNALRSHRMSGKQGPSR